jgi:hypothetical protein
MNDRTHGASRIKALRISMRPGASAFTQLAAGIFKRGRARAGAISVGGFIFPYNPGIPVLACPGRKTLAPAFSRRPTYR